MRPLSEGGMVAERFGDTSFQRRLVIFHDKQVMAIFIANMLTNLPLSEDRIANVSLSLTRRMNATQSDEQPKVIR